MKIAQEIQQGAPGAGGEASGGGWCKIIGKRGCASFSPDFPINTSFMNLKRLLKDQRGQSH
jgi:hypothetical protein